MTQSVVDKVRKLLRLSTSSNAHEAALAAAKAQELIDRHQLEQVCLELDTPSVSMNEPIRKFDDAPLEGGQRDRWRQALASCVARANSCRVFLVDSNIMLVGRPSDVDGVRYLFAWLVREVERLAQDAGAGKGRTWRNNFRLGAVEAIRVQLQQQHTTFAETLRREADGNPQALARVNQALVHLDERRTAVDAWVRAHMRIGAAPRYAANYDGAARDAGRRAGASIAIGKARRGLSAGIKTLPA
jgi:Protein of unknown function (DUF2786)